MDHIFLLAHEKCRPNRRHFFKNNLLILVLALLVGDAAAGLASRLAGGLAFAAAAVLGALAQIAGLDGLNMLHGRFLLMIILFIKFTMGRKKCQSRFLRDEGIIAGKSFGERRIRIFSFLPTNYKFCLSEFTWLPYDTRVIRNPTKTNLRRKKK